MGKYKDMPGIRILEETMRIAVGNGKRALLFLLTRPLGHSLEYRMWKGDLKKC
jgi:hypothetical protein